MKQWAVFSLLGLVWGSSFLWIKIAVAETGPLTLVSFRILFGLIGLVLIMVARRQNIRMSRSTVLAFIFMGVFNTAVPFVLITWGEQYIASSLAAILNATVPLFTIVLAHFWLNDEKITLPKLVGLVVGFVGVVVLVSRDFQPEVLRDALAGAGLWGQAAVLLASVSYAVAATFSRRHLRGQPPILQSGMMLLVANGVMWAVTPVVERPMNFPDTPLAWFAILWLGVLGSCLAYVLFFYLMNAWGPTRASLVTYVFPVIGLILGIIFLREPADWRLVVGALLIVGGIGVVNFRPKPKQPEVKAAAAAALGAD